MQTRYSAETALKSAKVAQKNKKTVITNHNSKILGTKPSTKTSACNCPNNEAFPLNGQCQIRERVYEAALSNN